MGKYTSTELHVALLHIAEASKEINWYLHTERPETVGGISSREIVLVGREEHVGLDSEMLAERKIEESAQLGTYTSVGRYGTLSGTSDEKIAHVDTGKQTAGNHLRQFLLVERVEHDFFVELNECIARARERVDKRIGFLLGIFCRCGFLRAEAYGEAKQGAQDKYSFHSSQ